MTSDIVRWRKWETGSEKDLLSSIGIWTGFLEKAVMKDLKRCFEYQIQEERCGQNSGSGAGTQVKEGDPLVQGSSRVRAGRVEGRDVLIGS